MRLEFIIYSKKKNLNLKYNKILNGPILCGPVSRTNTDLARPANNNARSFAPTSLAPRTRVYKTRSRSTRTPPSASLPHEAKGGAIALHVGAKLGRGEEGGSGTRRRMEEESPRGGGGGAPRSGAEGLGGGDPQDPEASAAAEGRKGKSCKGCLYYSSLRKSQSRNPMCFGISRTLPQG